MSNKFNVSNNFNYTINIVNIYDCFEFDKKINVMSGANGMYCTLNHSGILIDNI